MAIPSFPTLTTWLRRAPVVLPRAADHVSEWWWRQPSRVRLATPVAVLAIALLAINPFATDDDPVDVLVTVRHVPPGATLSEQDVTRQARPRRFTPPAHLTAVGGVAAYMIPQGSVLVESHVATSGASTGLSHGHVAVALPRDMLPPVGIGDTVTLVDVQFDGQARTVAQQVRLFHHDDDVLWFAVLQADAINVAAAAHHGRITTIVHPRPETIGQPR